MIESVEVRPGEYYDSLRLLTATAAAQGVDGVDAALVAMGTELNRGLLADLGFSADELGPDDLVVAVRAQDEATVEAARVAVGEALRAVAARHDAAEQPPASVTAAARRSPAEVAIVAVPGEHAFVEAMAALEAGLHVMVFSDNVALEHEVALKARAAELGLLVMGPDCGTVILGGLGLGFANVVEPGPVSIVGASGTGIQQVCALLDDARVGVRHAIGTGGRDLTEAVGAASTKRALALLDEDPGTETIVLVGKAPGAAALDEAVASCQIPVVSAVGRTLTEAVGDIAGAGWTPHRWGQVAPDPGGRLVGLFSGGTLRDEAAAITEDDSLLDLGADEFTVGRAHPMIDLTLRLEHLRRAVEDPDVGTVLLDVVLGHGAHPDPMAVLGPELARLTDRGGRALVSLCGTRGDPQGRDHQAEAAVAAGAAVFLSNADAARSAVR